MTLPYHSSVCIAVLNPGGRDPRLDYSQGSDHYESGVHAPINFHAFAAATYGAFFDSTEEVIREKDRFDAVLVLIRRRTWLTLAAVRALKKAGMRVITSWKECSHNQVSRQLSSARAIRAYGHILNEVDGIISPTLAWPPRIGCLGQQEFRQKLKFIPTPYPVDLPAWNFVTPLEERVGIFIGTREFKTEVRNHVNAIAQSACLAREFDLPRVTVVNSEGRKGMKLLRELESAFPADCLQIIEERLPYPRYMQLLSSHRLVFQMDRSTVPGQVGGDSLLARTICSGGSSTIEKMAFPDFCDDTLTRMEDVFEQIERALHDDAAYMAAVDKSQEIAKEYLSFEAVAKQLSEWSAVTG